MQQDRLLILSDGKPGHLNQSIAFARHLGYDFDVCVVTFKNRLSKAFSYVADFFRMRLVCLFQIDIPSVTYRAVVSAGSETYYANRILARKRGIKSVAIMLPKGYRYNFSLIVAQDHDKPPEQDNIISLPVNLAFIEPQGVVTAEADTRYISLIIGGDSRGERLQLDPLKKQLSQIRDLFPEHEVWLTTSRRTAPEIEAMLREFSYARAIYSSQENINPIPDFLQQSDYVFVTADSTSMISEAVSFGHAAVEILSVADFIKGQDKSSRFLGSLEKSGCLHFFDGNLGAARKKIDLTAILAGVEF